MNRYFLKRRNNEVSNWFYEKYLYSMVHTHGTQNFDKVCANVI